MAQLYATGPVSIFVGVGAGAAPVFLGHGDKAPSISLKTQYREVECDLGGMVALDAMYGGESATVTVTLVRYNENVLSVLQDRVNVTGTTTRGLDDPGDIGTLMLTEGMAYQLWLRFPYAAKAAYSNAISGAMPAGYRFVAAFLQSPDDIEVGSNTAKKVRLTWTCLRAFDPTISNNLGQGRFLLYDHSVLGLPSIN